MSSGYAIDTLGQYIKVSVAKGDKAIENADQHYIAAGGAAMQ